MRRIALLFLVFSPLHAQDQDTIRIRRPKDIDDATWERLKKGYEREKERFAKLLTLLDQNRIDYASDDLAAILKKRRALRDVLEKNSGETIAAMASPDALALNTVLFRNETAPRLSGRVVTIGPKGDYPDLMPARREAALKPGDLIRLAEGEYHLGEGISGGRDRDALTDIAIVGSGPDKTTLGLNLCFGRRIRVEGVKIDCQENECVDMRLGGSVYLKDCLIYNYNSGAGGSNAIFGVDSVMLVEGCTFEGMSGRAGGRRGSGGKAFDLRGDNLLYVRKSKFIDNSEILRASFPCAFDECASENSTDFDFGILPYQGGSVFVRKNKAKLTAGKDDSAREFQHATDDAEFVEYALGERREIDRGSQALAERIEVRKNLPYWIGLLRHPDQGVRDKAARRFEALTGEKIRSGAREATPAAIDEAIGNLDSDDLTARDSAAAELEAVGEAAREKLKAASENGSEEKKARAKTILSHLDVRREFGPELEYSRAIRWFEENRLSLVWDEESSRYVKKK